MRLSVSERAVSMRIGTLHRLAQALGELQPVLARHHHVDDEEIESQPGELPARLLGVAGAGHAKAVAAEIAREQVADARVVVDDEEVRRVVGQRCVGRWFGHARMLGHRRHRPISRPTLSRSPGSMIEPQEALGADCARPARAPPARRRCGAPAAPSRRSARARPAVGRVEEALAAVTAARPLLDEAGVDQLLQDAAEALLGDLQNVEEVGDADAGMAVDEVERRDDARGRSRS